MRLAKKVLLIGWDAADWKIISPMLDAGLMPTLSKFVDEGVMGNLATLDPPLSPILWTSIATGKTADEHGILGFVEPDTNTMSVRPVSSRSRRVKAIWNILTQQGLKSNVVGWWPSNPAEPINGVMVSNFFQKVKAKYGEPWQMPSGSVHPQELEQQLSEMRVHPGELTLSHILPFVPDALKVDQEKDKHLSSVAKILAECSSIHAASTWLMQNTEWDFMAVYHDAVDHFCHGFMKFHPPQRKNIPDEMFNLYHEVVRGAYRFHDMMLERLLQLAGDDTTVIIMSDHGFHSDHLRPNRIPKEPAGPAYEHAPFGIFTMKGPHVKKDERIYGATLLDIAPTLLTLFGLPVGRDMIGKPLLQSFENEVVPNFIDSWEKVEGDAGMLPSDVREDPWAAQAAMDQLVELGYVEKPGEDKEKAVKKIQDESQYYLARVLIYRKKHEEAIPILEKIFSDSPEKLRYGLALHESYMAVKKIAEARTLTDKLRTTEAAELARLDLMEAGVLIAEHKPRKAMELLLKAEQRSSHLPYYFNELGKVYQRIGKWKESKNVFLRALEIDANNSTAHLGVARSNLRMGLYSEAANEALAAIALLYKLPQAHFVLSEALYNLGDMQQAATGFEIVCDMIPGSRKAHQWLIKIYNEHLHQPEKAKHHEQFIMENIKGNITIVSGLPRSGTSMIMQMLKAGGLEIFTDDIRTTDTNNPKGYLEHEKVKATARDNSWVNDANEKVVKVVAPLLPFLPDSYNYKIIFMQREMDEVLRSQQVMLGHHRAVRLDAYPVALADAFNKQLEKADAWIARTPAAEVLKLNYADVIANPLDAAETIATFLDEDMETEKMAEVVDAALYRNKKDIIKQKG